MLDIKEFHKTNAPKEELESVVIVAEGSSVLGTVNLPDGYKVTDFEYIEFASCTDGGAVVWDTARLTKGAYLAGLTDLRLSRAANNLGSNYELSIQNITDTSFDVAVPSAAITTTRLYYAIGYKKRYATKNRSTTVMVNDGVDVVPEQRYEIDIATALGTDYLNKDLLVQVQIFNNTGSGEAGWFTVGDDSFYDSAVSAWRHAGAKWEVVGGKIYVATAGYGGRSTGNDLSRLAFSEAMNVLGSEGSINAAPCRLKVWKIDDYVRQLGVTTGRAERIYNPGTDVMQFTSIGDNGLVPLAPANADNDLFEWDATNRLVRFKETRLYTVRITEHANDQTGTANVWNTMLVFDDQAYTNPDVVGGALEVVHANDGGSTVLEVSRVFDSTKWYAIHKQNTSNGNVAYTAEDLSFATPPTTGPTGFDLTGQSVTAFAFTFTVDVSN